MTFEERMTRLEMGILLLIGHHTGASQENGVPREQTELTLGAIAFSLARDLGVLKEVEE